jgi:hypothetical protein
VGEIKDGEGGGGGFQVGPNIYSNIPTGYISCISYGVFLTRRNRIEGGLKLYHQERRLGYLTIYLVGRIAARAGLWE